MRIGRMGFLAEKLLRPAKIALVRAEAGKDTRWNISRSRPGLTYPTKLAEVTIVVAGQE